MYRSHWGGQYMDTKGIIIEAFRKLLETRKFDDITVQNILDEAHCSRGTFYRHFKDKYDIMNYYYSASRQAIHSKPGLSGTKKIRLIIDSLIKNAHYFRGVVDTEGTNSFLVFTKNSSTRYFLDIYRKKSDSVDPIPAQVRFMADFLSGGYASIIRDWIIKDNELSKNELAECLYKMTPEEFRD